MLIVLKLNEKIEPKSKLSDNILKHIRVYKNFFESSSGIWYKGSDLKEYFGFKSVSEIRQLINYLRLNENMSIISSGKLGYKHTKDIIEIEDYYEKLQHRALTILSVAKSIKNNI
jgi:hypothetical protein